MDLNLAVEILQKYIEKIKPKVSEGESFFLKVNERASEIQITALGGGCINQVYQIVPPKQIFDRSLVVKVNRASLYSMFIEEARGLELLAQASQGELKIPKVLDLDCNESYSWLVLENIEEISPGLNYWEELAHGLFIIHQNQGVKFGLDQNNWIGSLPQINTVNPNWCDFFMENRLLAQAQTALQNQLVGAAFLMKIEAFYPCLKSIFGEPNACLIHGDLWSGNLMSGLNGPVLIDPAVYFGIPELDLGMSQLFGGFSPEFYSAYQKKSGMDADWVVRAEICNLYPLLVHLNLFGRSYLVQIERILRKYS